MLQISRPALGALAVITTLSLPAAAHGQATATSVTLTAGTLSFSVVPQADPFPATTLNGRAQALRTGFHTWAVNDARGSGAGWNVTMRATPMDDGLGHTWPSGSLQLSAPATVLPVGVNAAIPPLAQGATFTLDGAQPVKVLSAAAAAGQGDWTLTQANLLGGDLVLTVPANALAGTYTTTITSTLATGP
jgi:hypothetical protein